MKIKPAKVKLIKRTTKLDGPKRPYAVFLKKGGGVETSEVSAADRREAVYRAQTIFWETYGGSLGSARDVLTVSDPYNEVVYTESFHCTDIINKLLTEEVIERLIKESKGELMRDTRPCKPKAQPGSVKRVKRRRDLGTNIAPNIKRMANGVLYYKIVRVPQKSSGGKIKRKRKMQDIRLEAKNLQDALLEIKKRNLNSLNKKVKHVRRAERDPDVIGHLAGVKELPSKKAVKVKKTVMRYAPRVEKTKPVVKEMLVTPKAKQLIGEPVFKKGLGKLSAAELAIAVKKAQLMSANGGVLNAGVAEKSTVSIKTTPSPVKKVVAIPTKASASVSSGSVWTRSTIEQEAPERKVRIFDSVEERSSSDRVDPATGLLKPTTPTIF